MIKGVVLACAIGAALAASVNCTTSATTHESCLGPTFGSFNVNPTCSNCIKKNCGGQLSNEQSQCSAFDMCFCSCHSGDTNCQDGCYSMLTMPCTQAEQDLSNCSSMNCLEACNSADGSGGVSPPTDSGGGSGSGGG
jgi:hypothetical protein